MEQREEHSFKVLVVGEASTGKTSTINRFVHSTFSEHYKTTLGVDFALKVLLRDKMLIRLQLRDIAGQERAGSMTRVYYKDASAAFIVFDLTRPQTFEAVKLWKHDVDDKVKLPDGSPLPVILLANKCDLADPARFQDLDSFVREHGFVAWFPTSAKENKNITEAVNALVEQMLQRAANQRPKPQDPNILSLTGGKAEAKTGRDAGGSKCC